MKGIYFVGALLLMTCTSEAQQLEPGKAVEVPQKGAMKVSVPGPARLYVMQHNKVLSQQNVTGAKTVDVDRGAGFDADLKAYVISLPPTDKPTPMPKMCVPDKTKGKTTNFTDTDVCAALCTVCSSARITCCPPPPP